MATPTTIIEIPSNAFVGNLHKHEQANMNNQRATSIFRPRCYLKSPTAQHVFQPVLGLISYVPFMDQFHEILPGLFFFPSVFMFGVLVMITLRTTSVRIKSPLHFHPHPGSRAACYNNFSCTYALLVS